MIDPALPCELYRTLTDGVITLRASAPEDNEALVAGRDPLFHRFMGAGHPEPNPVACVLAGDTLVGWIDYDTPRPWLDAGEVNVGYNIFPEHRNNGYATRALELLVTHLTEDTDVSNATLLIHPDNAASLAVARRANFSRYDDVDDECFYKRPTWATN